MSDPDSEWDYKKEKLKEELEKDSEGLYETVMKLSDDSLKKIRAEALEQDIDESVVIENWVRQNKGGFFVGEFDIEESVVTLKHIDPWGALDVNVASSGAPDIRTANRKVYRRLRDTFPPIKAGIEYAKSFTSGGGFTVDIDNVNSKLEQGNRKIIDALNRNIFQDEIVRGMSSLLDIMMDDTLTVGSSGAEIVYDNEINTDKLIVGDIPVTDFPLDTPNIPEFETRDPNDKEWKKLGGVAQLKIIDDAIERLIPYRNPTTYRIEYWTIDEKRTQKLNEERKTLKMAPMEPRKLLPFQVLWLPWSIRGTDITGHSLAEGVADIALLLEKILGAVGISFQKWSDKKYFFILGTTDGRTWAAPKVRQFLHDIKKMTSSNGTGIAVPAGFDIKEIGGEIFEGGQIIDYLLTLICNGMTYPKTFLTQGSTNEGDQAWMAWIRTYSNYQNLLTTNVEHQLWARHLYCKVGTSQEVAKQGVSAGSRKKVPTYVPLLSWRSDGKWQTQTKIDQQTRVLNVANPIDPSLKLQIEKDIAITLGFTELDWKPAEILLAEEQKNLLIMYKIETIKSQMLIETLEQAYEDKIHLDMNPQLKGLSAPKEEGEEIGAVQDVGQDEVKDKKEDEDGTPEEKGKKEKRPKPVPGKRLEGGVSRTPKDKPSNKGKSKPLGGSRQAKPRKVEEAEEVIEDEVEIEVEDEVEETTPILEPEKPQKVELEITVKQENTPQEILVKTEPIVITSEPQKIDIDIKSEPQKIDIDVKSEPQKIDIDIKSEPLKITSEPQKIDIDVKSETQKVMVETTSKQDPIVLKIDDTNQNDMIEKIEKMLEEKYKDIEDIASKNENLLREIEEIKEQMKSDKQDKEDKPLSEQELLEIELNKRKLEIFQKLLDNKEDE